MCVCVYASVSRRGCSMCVCVCVNHFCRILCALQVPLPTSSHQTIVPASATKSSRRSWVPPCFKHDFGESQRTTWRCTPTNGKKSAKRPSGRSRRLQLLSADAPFDFSRRTFWAPIRRWRRTRDIFSRVVTQNMARLQLKPEKIFPLAKHLKQGTHISQI